MIDVGIIQRPTDEDWMRCKLAALITMGYRKVKTPPNDEWKHKMLKARHKPIHELRFFFVLDGIPSFVAGHLVRHVHSDPYVQTKRDDRVLTKDEFKGLRDRDVPLIMGWSMNAEELMTVANKRLCGKAHEKTREVVSDICNAVIEVNPEFEPFLVPQCVWHGGVCHEFERCGIPLAELLP